MKLKIKRNIDRKSIIVVIVALLIIAGRSDPAAFPTGEEVESVKEPEGEV